MRVWVIHGPNLNLLGERQPEIYGGDTLSTVNDLIAATARTLDIEVLCRQYNGEGQIIDALHAAREQCEAIVINPGAYAHYSYAIADAIAALAVPVVEVHLSNIAARETFRRTSVTAGACRGTIGGFGAQSYVLALHAVAKMVEK